MPNLVRIPQPLQALTQGAAEVTAEGQTARELIADLENQFAGIAERLLDEQKKLRRFVNIYLNDEDIRFLQDLDTPIGDGDTISIVPAIAGGVQLGDESNVQEKFYLTFPEKLIKRPILWEMMNKFDVIANIRTASVSNELGLIALELEGPEDQINAAADWLKSLDVTVEPLEKNVIE